MPNDWNDFNKTMAKVMDQIETSINLKRARCSDWNDYYSLIWRKIQNNWDPNASAEDKRMMILGAIPASHYYESV